MSRVVRAATPCVRSSLAAASISSERRSVVSMRSPYLSERSPVKRLALVQALDGVGVLLGDDLAFDLECWRQLFTDLEVVSDQDPLLHLLHVAQLLVHRLDVLTDLSLQRVVRSELVHISRQALRFGERRALLAIKRQQGGDERAPVTDRDRMRDERVLLPELLDVAGRDVLATGGDDEILLAVGDAQVPIAVELADITGVQPPVGQCFRSGLRLLVVAGKHDATLHQALPVFGESHLVAAHGLAHSADAGFARPVHRGQPGVLGLPVYLEYLDAEGGEEAQRLRRYGRRTAGDQHRLVEPDLLAQRAEHQPLGETVRDTAA